MNAQTRIAGWELGTTRRYTDHSAIVGTHVASITDAVTGIETASFRDSFGSYFAVPMNVDLCAGCDAVVVHGCCADCEMIFDDATSLAPVVSVNGGVFA